MKISNPNEERIHYPISNIVRDVWGAGKEFHAPIVLGSIIRAIGDISGLFPSLALSFIITEVAKAQEADVKKIFIFFVIWFIAMSARYLSMYFAKKMIFHSAIDIALKTEKKMIALLFSKDSAWHEKERSGTKVKRIEKGSLAYNDIIRMWVGTYIEVIIRFIGIPLILMRFDKTIGILLIVFIVTYFSFSKYLQKKCIERAYLYNVKDDNASGAVTEAVSNIRTVRTLHIGDTLLAKIEQYLNEVSAAARSRINAFQFRGHITGWYAQFFLISVISFIAYGILHGNYQVGFLLLFFNYFNNIWEQVSELTNVSQDMIVAQQSIARMYETIGKEMPKDSGTKLFPKNWSVFKAENVSFSYDDNEALNDISFSVERGHKVGIVGLSGAGKSTLFKLLLKERNDYSGLIAVDDISISDISDHEFYKNVSIVPQDTEVFNFSLKENITLANPDAAYDTELLEKALEVSHVKDFLHKLPKGIETLIGEKGVKLSGGERQRLGIARAIFKQPEILLLDEATSHLDLESEEKIKDSLHHFFTDITALVIAHRLTTIREMDKIIVIEKGKIIEEGSFDELCKKKGRFLELWEKQKFN